MTNAEFAVLISAFVVLGLIAFFFSFWFNTQRSKHREWAVLTRYCGAGFFFSAGLGILAILHVSLVILVTILAMAGLALCIVGTLRIRRQRAQGETNIQMSLWTMHLGTFSLALGCSALFLYYKVFSFQGWNTYEYFIALFLAFLFVFYTIEILCILLWRKTGRRHQGRRV